MNKYIRIFKKGHKIIKNELGSNKWDFVNSQNDYMNYFNTERDNSLKAFYGEDNWNKMDSQQQRAKRNAFFTQYQNWTPQNDSDVFQYSDDLIVTNPITSSERVDNILNDTQNQYIRKFNDNVSESLNDKAEKLSQEMNNKFTQENNSAYQRANIGSKYSRRFGTLDKKAGRYKNAKTGKAFTAQEIWDLQQQLGLTVDGDLGNATYNALVKNGYIKPIKSGNTPIKRKEGERWDTHKGFADNISYIQINGKAVKNPFNVSYNSKTGKYINPKGTEYIYENGQLKQKQQTHSISGTSMRPYNSSEQSQQESKDNPKSLKIGHITYTKGDDGMYYYSTNTIFGRSDHKYDPNTKKEYYRIYDDVWIPK